MTETLLVLGTDKQLRAFEHLLYHDSGSILNLHHTVELQSQVLGCADVQRHTSYITLMHRSDDLRHNGIAHAVSTADQLVFISADHLRNHRDACAGEYLAHQRGLYIATLVDTHDGLVQTGNVNAIQLHLRGRRSWRAHDLAEGCG